MMRFVARRWLPPVLSVLLLCVAACSRDKPSAPDRSASQTADTIAGADIAAGRRIALVVGNSRYASSPLINPANDAELVSMTLMQVGFEVRLVQDGDQRAMKRAIQEFGSTLEAAGSSAVGLFYYAGHGVQLNGRNYLIPVGAEIQRDADVEIEAVSADWVIEQMRYARNRLNFLILDACRNNPFARSFRSADRGLAKMDAPAGVLIAYSTAPGDVAADGEGRNSPYSEALAEAIHGSSEPAELMFKRVRDQVRRNTASRQTPWESSSLTGDNFYFAQRPVIGAGAEAATDVGIPSATRETPAPLPEGATPVSAAPVPPSAPATSPPAPQPQSAAAYVPVEALTEPAMPAQVVPVASPQEPRYAGPPDDPATAPGTLCTRAAGRWRIDGEKTSGLVRLDADHTGASAAKFRKPASKLTWTCDVPSRRVIVHFDNGLEHRLTVDYIERLMFGSDNEGEALGYIR
jgi:hypothetical protein